jgi:hypothetical protein
MYHCEDLGGLHDQDLLSEQVHDQSGNHGSHE